MNKFDYIEKNNELLTPDKFHILKADITRSFQTFITTKVTLIYVLTPISYEWST